MEPVEEEDAHQRPAPVRRHRLDRKKNKKSRKGKLSKEEVAAVRTQVNLFLNYHCGKTQSDYFLRPRRQP